MRPLEPPPRPVPLGIDLPISLTTKPKSKDSSPPIVSIPHLRTCFHFFFHILKRQYLRCEKTREKEKSKGGATKFTFEKPWCKGYFLIHHHHPHWHNFHLLQSTHQPPRSCNDNVHASSSFSTKILTWMNEFTFVAIVPRPMQGRLIVHITTLGVTLLFCFIFQATNTSPNWPLLTPLVLEGVLLVWRGGFLANVVVLNVDLSPRFTFDTWTMRVPHLIENFSPKFKSPSYKIARL